jgi:hypothetical protein
MEFLSDNLLEKASAIRVQSNTDLTENLWDRNYDTPYESAGYDSNTATLISIEFSSPTVISHLLLMNNNFKKCRIFYNSLTANTFTPDFQTTTNAQTNLYIGFASITVNSISIQIDTCFTTTTEKSLGELILCEKLLSFDQNPEANKYQPVIDREFIEHKMPDGGIVQYNIKDKFTAKIGFSYITSAFYTSLLNIYEDGSALYFVPFPTMTSWDAKAYPVIWSGNFDFTYAGNNTLCGYKGNIILKERTSGD